MVFEVIALASWVNAMKALAQGYTVHIDEFNAESWYQIIDDFDDANIYQTWAYGEIRQGHRNLSHLILKRTDETVAAAQIRLFRVPLMGSGFAYVRWGPLWRTSSREGSIEVFRQVIRALWNEYVYRRRMVLRVFPPFFPDDTGELTKILQEEGFSSVQTDENSRTLIINLDLSLDELRKGLSPSWRRHLNGAEKHNLQIIRGTSNELFDEFIRIYDEMWQRKRFVETANVHQYKEIQKKLPQNTKMKILICRLDDKPCATAVCSTIGKTGLFLFGATNELGMETKASYLIHWSIIQWLREEGCTYYDLNGINPTSNPGTYQFKAGLCGKKNGRDVTFLGSFDNYKISVSSLAILLADRLRHRRHVTTVPTS
jgi:lipid II:glycine glycyltransferase (peptidoglycan interpeptide bridge formation enzyme)